ncbi:LacI family DNA-binding transcriptional regulator [Anaerosporobacter faecicola]|uniref:LacI family DNA-binding transcriptional regulator n=1 Tax=Anaerosporobacter faecicola TaxID=2718714 RepID=UPI00143BF949|nr:LacI family DNA-binding transcriptional regulator [Anaerosporobacter faecicola]
MYKNKTVYDIAAEAGVSVATVSRVINNSDKVAESTRAKIQDLIDKYDFKPNEVARSLYKNETKLIGFILPDITNPYYSTVLLEAEKYALEQGYTMMICNTLGDINNFKLYLRTLLERKVDGIIYMGGERVQTQQLSQLIKRYEEELPIVMVNWSIPQTNCFTVKSDEEQGFEVLLEEIKKKGYKDVALLAGRRGVMPTEIKVHLYEEAIQKGWFHHRKEYLVDGDFTVESGKNEALHLLQLPNRPQVIIGINDIIAVGALNACHMLRLSVPEDVKIIGFDNINLTRAVYPTMTTVSHDYVNLAHKAVDLIVDKSSLLKKERRFLYPMEYICRESF